MREELEHVETAREPKLVLQDRGDASHLPLTVPDTWPQSLMMCGTWNVLRKAASSLIEVKSSRRVAKRTSREATTSVAPHSWEAPE